MFHPVQKPEADNVIQKLLSGKISFIGRTDNKVLVLAKATKIKNQDFSKFNCELKSNKELQEKNNITFSFVCFGKKYLFNAICLFNKNNSAIITPTTDLFFLQRRKSERLIMPENYYAVLKIKYINNKISRTFVKISDISIGGCGVLLRSSEPNLTSGDLIKGAMHFSSRPPLDIEGQVRHKQTIEEGNLKLQQFGLLFLPSESVTMTKKMKVIVMDLYRDIFRER
jgi:hypothetical protein